MKSMTKYALIAALALVGGCVERSSMTVGPISQDPIKTDQAMELRPWDKSVALYENGGVSTYPTGFAYVPEDNDPSYAYYGSDMGVFGVNLVTMPYTFYKNPPWERSMTSTGVRIPETYTANPPQPGVAEDVTSAPTTAPTTGPVQTTP